MHTGAQTNGLGAQSHGPSLGHGDARYCPQHGATVRPEPLQPPPTRSGSLAATTYAPYEFLIHSPAIRNTTQLIENNQSGPFLIDSNFGILRPSNSRFDSKSPRPTDYYSLTTDRCLRCPCASIARGAKMKCSRTRTTYTVRHNQ